MKLFRSRKITDSLRHQRFSTGQRLSHGSAPLVIPEVKRLRRVLVIDQSAGARRVLRTQLEKEGFEVFTAPDDATALEIVHEESPALVVMDLELPGSSGRDFYHRLKNDPTADRISVLILSARSGEEDKIAALEMGVDDYVTKPFSAREVALRAKAILRYKLHRAMTADQVKVGGIEINRPRCEVKVAGDLVALTPVEFKLLEVLSKRHGRVQTRKLLLEELWGMNAEHETRTVDSHVRRLRAKLGAAAGQIATVRGFGYRLDEEAEVENGAAELECLFVS